MHDYRLLLRMHKLDRILNRDNVAGKVLVDVIDHRRERSGFTTTGWPRHHHEPFAHVAKFLQYFRQIEGVEG